MTVTVRNIGLLCVLLVMTGVLHVQSKSDSWDALRKLRNGEKIEVVESGMKKQVGSFSMVNDEAIQFRKRSNDFGVRKENVVRVSVLDKSHRLRNALIFAAVGGGAGAAIGAVASGPNSTLGRGLGTALGAGAGLAVGAGLGAALPSYPTVYRADAAKAVPSH